jgi:glycosyltransferase involved in cell wall biosynthesis
MERPLVTIITPVLNRVTTLGMCLESVAGQTYQPIEHIVVDGGSTDGTIELLESHRESHRLAWISEPDHGMYDALNKGIDLAHGQIVAYLNSDDFYFPWSVEVAVRALRSGVDLIYGDLGILRMAPNGEMKSFYLQFYRDFDLRHYAFVGTIGQPTVFWHRDLTERIGPFDTRYRLIGDCEYWLRAAAHGARLKHIPEVMAVQLEHDATLRSTQSARLRDEFESLRTEIANVVDPPSSPRWENLRRRIAWRTRQVELMLALRARRPRKWQHFVGLLRRRGVRTTMNDFRMLAPARWRGSASLFGDPSRLFEHLESSARW